MPTVFPGCLLSPSLSAQTAPAVALTVDDLPFVPGHGDAPVVAADAASAADANRRLLHAFGRHHVPVTGFVIGKSVEALGTGAGTEILRQWLAHGLDLGNHSYSHLDFDDHTAAQFEEEVTRGGASIAPLLSGSDRRLEYFRFPFNHTGDTEEKHDAVAAFLAAHGYRLAPCTIENSDWMFNQAYVKMLARHESASAARLRKDYVAFTAAQIDYFMRMNREVLGYEPPEIMLLHDNRLNSETIEEILGLFEERGFHFVSLGEAEKDPIYRAPDTVITSYGPMWGYRWARARNVKVDGSLEPEPPKWIADYGANKPPPPQRPRASF